VLKLQRRGDLQVVWAVLIRQRVFVFPGNDGAAKGYFLKQRDGLGHLLLVGSFACKRFAVAGSIDEEVEQ
jgi:hypothetical protein